MSTIVNCTPHAIQLLREEDGEWDTLMVLEPSGLSVRVVADTENVGSVTCDEQEFDVRKRVFGNVNVTDSNGEEATLETKEGTFYVVSRIAAEAMPERDDLLLVDGTVRGDSGQIIGCTGFAVLQ
tara:strand:+ start:74 stop:448 length:375 start_codon:yes stop_codon:yes gene_type:complete